jgi:tRNA 2-thiocytidine biosynthesis protein TtcA
MTEAAAPLATAPLDAAKADKLAFYLLKAVNKVNREQGLFADGDRILVAVSGGKDSLTCLDLLQRRQKRAKEHYALVAAHIRSDYYCGRAVPLAWLRAWCAERGIALAEDKIEIARELEETPLSRCFRCSWQRRKALFSLADRLGCNKMAFGHHADDIAETTLLNLFYNARLRRMEPKMALFAGRLIVIRPLSYVEERDILPFVRASGYPIAGEPCPDGQQSRRAVMKRILREIEGECRDAKRHLYRAMEHYQNTLRRASYALPRDEASEEDQ